MTQISPALQAQLDVLGASNWPLKGPGYQRHSIGHPQDIEEVWQKVPELHRCTVTRAPEGQAREPTVQYYVSVEAMVLLAPLMLERQQARKALAGPHLLNIRGNPREGPLLILKFPAAGPPENLTDTHTHKDAEGTRHYTIPCWTGDLFWVVASAPSAEMDGQILRGAGAVAVALYGLVFTSQDGLECLLELAYQGWLVHTRMHSEHGYIYSSKAEHRRPKLGDRAWWQLEFEPGTYFRPDDFEGTTVLNAPQHRIPTHISDPELIVLTSPEGTRRVRGTRVLESDWGEQDLRALVLPVLVPDSRQARPTREQHLAWQEARKKEDWSLDGFLATTELKPVPEDYVEVPGAEIEKVTDRAYLVRVPGALEAVWFPKAQTIHQANQFYASRWILGQKGLTHLLA